MNAYFGVTDKKNIRFSIYPMTLIEIDNCDKMEFEEIITSFKDKHLFYSNECKKYMKFTINGKEVPHNKYPLLTVPNNSTVNFKVDTDVVILKYGYNNFIFVNNEWASNAFNYIKGTYRGCNYVSIQEANSKKPINPYDNLKKNSQYSIRVIFRITFHCIDKYFIYQFDLDFLSATVSDAKKQLADKIEINGHRLKPANIIIFDENKEKKFIEMTPLRNIQKFSKPFYYDIDDVTKKLISKSPEKEIFLNPKIKPKIKEKPFKEKEKVLIDYRKKSTINNHIQNDTRLKYQNEYKKPMTNFDSRSDLKKEPIRKSRDETNIPNYDDNQYFHDYLNDNDDDYPIPNKTKNHANFNNNDDIHSSPKIKNREHYYIKNGNDYLNDDNDYPIPNKTKNHFNFNSIDDNLLNTNNKYDRNKKTNLRKRGCYNDYKDEDQKEKEKKSKQKHNLNCFLVQDDQLDDQPEINTNDNDKSDKEVENSYNDETHSFSNENELIIEEEEEVNEIGKDEDQDQFLVQDDLLDDQPEINTEKNDEKVKNFYNESHSFSNENELIIEEEEEVND